MQQQALKLDFHNKYFPFSYLIINTDYFILFILYSNFHDEAITFTLSHFFLHKSAFQTGLSLEI